MGDSPYDARDKARQVLRSVLADADWATFEEKGIVVYAGRRGIYILSPYGQTIIRDLSSGRMLGRACLQLSVVAPAYDRMAAEYVVLKNAEEFYWKTANIFEQPMEHIAEVLLVIFDLALLFYLVVLIT